MKKILTLCFIALSLPAITKAQLNMLGVDLGIKLGGNFTDVGGKYWENGYKANFMGGGFLGVNGPVFGAQIEAMFSQSTYQAGQGFNGLYKDLFNAGKESVQGGTFRVNYISVPVLLNVKLIPKVKLQVGPQFSRVVTVIDKDDLMKDARSIFKSGSIDAVGGIWIDLPFKLNVGARYIIALSNMNNEDGNTYTTKINDAWKQKTLQVHIGYTLL